MDDFDSLLKAVAEEYNKTPFTGSDVSNMIDARLSASRKELDLQLKREIYIIIACMAFLVLVECVISIRKYNTMQTLVMAQHINDIGGIVYSLFCLVMFRKLRQISASNKDTHIRNYIRSIYEKTQRVLGIYLWTSTGIGIAMITVHLILIPHIKWYWALVIWLLTSVMGYYVNAWYIRKRFGKRIQEMKELIAEFE